MFYAGIKIQLGKGGVKFKIKSICSDRTIIIGRPFARGFFKSTNTFLFIN